jgi:hypothetical protein
VLIRGNELYPLMWLGVMWAVWKGSVFLKM